MITNHSLLLIFVNFCIFCIKFCVPIKWWIENPEFSNPQNWESQKIPCPFDKIVFPKLFSSGIYLPNDLKTNGLILPNDGLILLHSNSKISFTNQNDNNNDKKLKNSKCENPNNLAKLRNVKNRNWFNPANWKEFPGTEQNPATPHIERIPCSNEKVIMGLDGPISIDLDYVDELHIGGLHFGHKDLTSDEFKFILESKIGQSLFKNAENTDIQYFNEPICGCHKIDKVVEYQWKVCKYAKNTCKLPKCIDPIVPTGHCCSECGSSLKLHIDNCTSFNLNLFKMQLNKVLKQVKKLSDEVHIDYRMVNDGGDEFLQLVILDKDEYNEKSIKLMNILKETLLKENYNNVRKTFHMSGIPYTPEGKSDGWIFMLTSLLGVLAFFGVIILYYMPEKSPIALPVWMIPRRYQVFNSPFVFARFDNTQSTDVEITGGAIINNTDNENADGDNDGAQQGTTSFNNPMFDENVEKQITQEISSCPLENEMSEIELEETHENK